MKYLPILFLVSGCGMMENLGDAGPELADRGVGALGKIAENPSWLNVIAEVGGYLAFVVATALGGKHIADKRRFKKIENGGSNQTP